MYPNNLHRQYLSLTSRSPFAVLSVSEWRCRCRRTRTDWPSSHLGGRLRGRQRRSGRDALLGREDGGQTLGQVGLRRGGHDGVGRFRGGRRVGRLRHGRHLVGRGHPSGHCGGEGGGGERKIDTEEEEKKNEGKEVFYLCLFCQVCSASCEEGEEPTPTPPGASAPPSAGKPFPETAPSGQCRRWAAGETQNEYSLFPEIFITSSIFEIIIALYSVTLQNQSSVQPCTSV